MINQIFNNQSFFMRRKNVYLFQDQNSHPKDDQPLAEKLKI